jgi:hypothetical protein
LILDMKGDGIDLGGVHPQLKVRWTKAGTDDAFVAVDADELSQMGYRIQQGSRVLRGTVLFQNDLRFVRPDGTTKDVGDAWEVLSVLDANGDGSLDSKDPAFRTLRIFVDANGDGVVDQAEVKKAHESTIQRIGPVRRRTTNDKNMPEKGTVEGTFQRTNDTYGRAVDVPLPKSE